MPGIFTRRTPIWLRLVLGLVVFAILVLTPRPQSPLSTTTSPSPTPPSPSPVLKTDALTPSATEAASFLRVVDGDTIKANLNGKSETVRIIGINTPETVDPRKSVECFGKEASQFAKDFFASSSGQLILEKDPTQNDRDKYGRLLRYVFTVDNSTDYGKQAISLGYAHEYTYQVPYKYQETYRQSEKSATENKLGLWADNVCSLP